MGAIVRTAPDGGRATITLPAEAGAVDWYGTTKLTGPEFHRDFGIGPRSEVRTIPETIMPGARVREFRRSGFDLVLYEAIDRSDSALVWMGPWHAATTWFGGPAPRTEVLNRLISLVDFADSESGARLTARPGSNVHQHSTILIGWGDQVVMMVRPLAETREMLPGWQGAKKGDAEVWRTRLDLDDDSASALSGSAYEWRYIAANGTTMYETIFPATRVPAGGDAAAEQLLARIDATWAA